MDFCWHECTRRKDSEETFFYWTLTVNLQNKPKNLTKQRQIHKFRQQKPTKRRLVYTNLRHVKCQKIVILLVVASNTENSSSWHDTLRSAKVWCRLCYGMNTPLKKCFAGPFQRKNRGATHVRNSPWDASQLSVTLHSCNTCHFR